jgi:AraC-like DNA-binding protein
MQRPWYCRVALRFAEELFGARVPLAGDESHRLSKSAQDSEADPKSPPSRPRDEVGEIALEVGYTSPSVFRASFRRVVGVTWTELRGSM